MNAGVIAHRYARAIYDYAAEKGKESDLYAEMQTLLRNFSAYPALRGVMNDPTVAANQKIELLTTACGIKSDEILHQVIGLAVRNGRAVYMENIARMYETVYRKAKNQIVVNLTTVEPADDALKQTLIPVIAQITGNQVEFYSQADPEIIGGFVMQIEDKRLDASVKNQLRVISYEL